MSRLDELIAELCPYGVEMLELQQLFITRNGYTHLNQKASFGKMEQFLGLRWKI